MGLIKLSATFFTDRKFKVTVEDEFSTPREIPAGDLQGYSLSPILHNLYINDAFAA
jgi:hypothetical protein